MKRTALITALLLSISAGGCGSSHSVATCDSADPCGAHGTCDDSSGSVLCTCDPGYTGEHCDGCDTGYHDDGSGTCVPDDPCAATTLCADLHRECMDDQGTAVCGPCLSGYTDYGDGECRDADPCAQDTACAAELRECVNDEGTAVCGDCLPGYTDYGDGQCRDADPCASDTTCAASNRECVNDQGAVACGDCLPGFVDVGGVCEAVCAPTHNPGVAVPFDMLLLLDRSASMQDSAKWPSTLAGISAFLAEPAAADISVGLQYFPAPPSGTIPTICTTDAQCGLYGPCLPGFNQCAGSMAPDTSCEPVDYQTPDVPITAQPAADTAIQTSFGNHNPDGSATPMLPALEGVLDYCEGWAQGHPGHRTQVVLITDGEPTGCNLNNGISGTATVAASALGGSPSIRTYVVGVGSTLGSLDPIAIAGGTGQMFLVDLSGNVPFQVRDALLDVRDRGRCRYQIPAAVTGSGDYHLVDMALTDPASPPDATDLAAVVDATACDPVTGGWHYDDVAAPFEIVLCEASCNLMDQHGLEPDVLVGCAP